MATVLTTPSRPLMGLTNYLAAMWKCRYFILSLVKIDLRTRYRRSLLGVGWSLLNPIAMTVVLCTVFHKIFGVSISEFGPFLMSGLVFWSFVTNISNTGCQCFFYSENYIRQYPAPMAIYPLRSTLSAAFHFMLGLSVVLALTWAVDGFGNLPALASLLPTMLLLLVLGWAVGSLTGLANVYFPDVQHLLEVVLQMLFYATPIIYPPDQLRTRGLGWIVDYNPIGAILGLVRSPILEGQCPAWETYAIAGGTTLFLVAVAVTCLMRLQRTLIFQL